MTLETLAPLEAHAARINELLAECRALLTVRDEHALCMTSSKLGIDAHNRPEGVTFGDWRKGAIEQRQQRLADLMPMPRGSMRGDACTCHHLPAGSQHAYGCPALPIPATLTESHSE